MWILSTKAHCRIRMELKGIGIGFWTVSLVCFLIADPESSFENKN